MAPPKRARQEAGSSGNNEDVPDYDVGRFFSHEAQLEYNKIRIKPIAKERGFKPTAEDGELLAMIQERGWQLFCREAEPVPMGLVREFYANAMIEKNGHAYVRGTVVNYQPEAIRALYRQPPQPEGVQDWCTRSHEDLDLDRIVAVLCEPGSSWNYSLVNPNEHVTFLAKYMNKYARAWNLFICAKLMPTSHTHEITVDRAILLWGILNDEYIDLGLFLHQSMVRFMDGGTTAAIPHASVVARLCQAAGIRWGDEEQLQQHTGPITHSTIASLVSWPGAAPHHRGLGYVMIAPEAEPAPLEREQRAARRARVARSAPSRVRPVMTSSQHRRLTRRVDTMYDMITRFTTDMGEALDDMGRAQGYEGNWPTFGAHHTYPPPDSPPEEGDDADD